MLTKCSIGTYNSIIQNVPAAVGLMSHGMHTSLDMPVREDSIKCLQVRPNPDRIEFWALRLATNRLAGMGLVHPTTC
jgi:hypothetical protein